MRISCRIAGWLLVVLLLANGSCVELTGQRISIRYDGSRDELALLIFHDGVHEWEPARYGDGPEQIAEHVRQGDILFLDWPGHVRMKDVEKAASADGTPPARREFARTVLASVRSFALGHYRDPRGRIGAAQLVVVSRASEVVARANAAISEAFLALEEPGPEWRLTGERLREAARRGHQWLALEGHSLRFSFPAHPREWARNKAEFLGRLLAEFEETARRDEKDRESALSLVPQLLSLSPLALSEGAGGVSIRLGDPERPETFRLVLRERYTTRLEEIVAREVPRPLDRELARRLCGEATADGPRGDGEILAWGPPEEVVRALVSWAEDPDVPRERREEGRKKALEHLAQWGERWNREHGIPEAPPVQEDPASYLQDWKRWYLEMLLHPLKVPAAAVEPAPREGWHSLFDGASLGSWKPVPFGGEGPVSVREGALVLGGGQPMTGVRWGGEFPAEDYEIRLEAQRVEGADFFCGLTFPCDRSSASLILGGWGGGLCGISSLDGLDASENETMTSQELHNGRWYDVRLRVARERIQAWLDGRKIVDVGTGGRKVSTRFEISPCEPLGFATYLTEGALRNIRWRRVEGPEE